MEQSQENGRESNEVMASTQPLELSGDRETILTDEYAAAYGEELSRTLNLDTWHSGDELMELYERLDAEVQKAIEQEDETRNRIRNIIFPRLRNRQNAPACAGVYQTKTSEIEQAHRGYLFNGTVEACDGNSIPYDTLPLTIVQIGVCLVSYQGGQGSWVHRLFRRDLRVSGGDPVEDTLDLLESRRRRTGYDQESQRDRLTSLGRRGIMAYAERAVLLKMSSAPWRMGHGNPAPYEILTGSGMAELADRGLDVLEELVLQHQRFVFVPSAPSDRMLLTIGNALRPLEYAVVDTLENYLSRIADGHYRGSPSWRRVGKRVQEFAKEAGPKMVVGMYRAAPIAPAQVFYTHVDHVHEAAHIALADSALQEHRGFPMLVTLADTVCSAIFGEESLVPHVQVAYSDAGAPLQYQTERQTRR